jgi:hypothetical protein
VKDPDGYTESHVYCVGIRAEEVSRIITWGTKREVLVELNEGGKLKYSVKCEEYLARPNVVMEERKDMRPCRRTLSDYVDAVVLSRRSCKPDKCVHTYNVYWGCTILDRP